MAAHNKIHIYIHKNRNKKSYKVTFPAKTLHTASLTYTQLFVNKSIPYLQPIAIIIIIIITDLYSAFRSENTEARICSGAVWTVHTVLDYLNSAFCTKILTYAGPLGMKYHS